MSAFKWFMSSAIFAFTVAQFLVADLLADLTSSFTFSTASGRGGVRLFLARRDLVVRFLLRGSPGIFSILRADREIGELFGEWFNHCLLLWWKCESGTA